METADLPLLHRWLALPHVLRWWKEELSLELLTPTVRLVHESWAGQFQRVCAGWKAEEAGRESDGVRALVARLKRARPSTYRHCVRTARHARRVGVALGFDEPRLRQLSLTAMMHDIGKVLVPEFILSRPRRPTRFERFVLNLHPNFGALLSSYYGLTAELRIRTQHHHERWDGRGYPHRLGGEDIPLMARVVQVADTFDAMVEQREYNTPRTIDEAVAELRRESRRQFDPRVVEAFLDTLPKE
jgi:HD-GYP domain-containing protein (c-di-GMP phosphodiesterase class II)